MVFLYGEAMGPSPEQRADMLTICRDAFTTIFSGEGPGHVDNLCMVASPFNRSGDRSILKEVEWLPCSRDKSQCADTLEKTPKTTRQLWSIIGFNIKRILGPNLSCCGFSPSVGTNPTAQGALVSASRPAVQNLSCQWRFVPSAQPKSEQHK